MLDKSFSFVLAYPSSVVSHIIEKLGPPEKGLVLDPFCGTGTTLVECKRRGLSSVGIDANPVCAMAAAVKTKWNIDSAKAIKRLKEVIAKSERSYIKISGRYPHALSFFSAPEVRRLSGYNSIINSEVIQRDWIGRRPALMALILSHYIRTIEDTELRHLLLVPLLGSLVQEFSKVRYGPELYRYERVPPTNVFPIYEEKARNLITAIGEHKVAFGDVSAKVLCGNSSDPSHLRRVKEKIELVITSPPYPAEHDYARITKLELAFGGFLDDEKTLQKIKKTMIPSSSKNSYVEQKFYDEVKSFSCVNSVRRKILAESKNRDHGFAKVYPRLVGDYFGAMYIHFKALSKVLPKKARCAYVVGDQSSFFGIRIHTAKILSKLVSSGDLNFRVLGIETWRTRRATRGIGEKRLPERILYFEKQ